MNYNDIICYIEDEIISYNDNSYYHAFKYSKENFINMITEGIKAPILLGKKGYGNNGLFYVCLAKKSESKKSCYIQQISKPMFVINPELKTYKARNYTEQGHYFFPFSRTFFPFRECQFDDEYHAFLIVKPNNILAIQYNLFDNFKKTNCSDEIKKRQLLILKSMIKDLDSQSIDLPIIDLSTSTKINKEKVLSLKI